MNVRMMPPQGPMGQPMPQGGSGGPPPQIPMGGPGTFPVGSMPATSGQQNKGGLGATFGGSAAGRGQFKQFMSSKKQQAPSMQVPQMPMAPAMPQSPMLPPPMPTNMGPMKPMGAPNMGGGAPQLGRQAPVGGGIGSAPMGVASNTNAVRGFADGGSVPRQTEIAGQPHYLAYINPEEGDILKGLGGAEAPGPGGIPSYFFHSGWGGGGSTSTSSNDDDDDDGGFSFSDWASDTWAEITSGGDAVTDTYNSGDSVSSGQNNNPNAGDGGGTSGGYSGDEFGSGNIYTETTPGASTVNFGNDDNDYSYTDTSSIAGISDASGVDYNPTANDVDDDPVVTTTPTFTSGGLEVRSLDSGIQYYVDEAGAFVGLVPENDNSLDPFGGAGPDISNDYVTNDGGISYTYDPIVSGGTGTTTAGTGGYDGSTYDEVPDVGAGTELDTTVSDYENEAYGGAIEDYYNPPPVYYDSLGNEYGSQSEATAAEDYITRAAEAEKARIAEEARITEERENAMRIALDSDPIEDDDPIFGGLLDKDYSRYTSPEFKGFDLTGGGNTIGYATSGENAGSAAIVKYDGRIEIIGPGSTKTGISFDNIDEAIEYLTGKPFDDSVLTDLGINLEADTTGATSGITLGSGTGNVTPAVITELAMGGEDEFAYDGDREAGLAGDFETDRYDFVDDLPDDALDFSAPVNEFDEIDDGTGTDFSTVPTGVGATDDDLATDFSTVSTETEKDLAFQNYLDGLVDTDFTDPEQTGLEAMEGSISDLPDNLQDTNILSDFDISEIESIAEDFMNSFDGKTEDELIADQGIMMPSDEAFARAEEDMSGLDILAEAALSGGTDDDTDVVVAKTREQKIDDLVAAGVDRTLAEASIDSLEGGVNVDDGTSAAELRDTLVEQVMSTQPTASELYLSAMGKVGSGISDFSPEEQRALYGARGQTPNAAETAYLQSLLRDVKHTSDGPIDEREYITEPTTYASTYNTETGKFEGSDQVTGGGGVIANPNFGKPMYEAGDSVAEQTLGETVEDFFVKAFDIFVNPLTIFGDDYTLEGANARNVQAQLDAYKNGGTFVYGDDGATVIGVAQPNFDASGDGNNDTVVLINDDGEITVSSDAIAALDIENSNKNSGLDSDVDDIDLIDSGTTFTNTEDGVVEGSTYDDIVVGGDDSGADPCPEGFYLDPVTGICMPMDDIGDVGDTSGGGISIGGITRGSSDYITGGVPSDVKGLKITKPKQFNRGGMVSPNIDRFIQSLAS